MICSIDFGASWIRSVFRSPDNPDRLSMFAGRSEYALIDDTPAHRTALEGQSIPYAICEGALAVVGNSAEKVQWLSRVPGTSLFVDGLVPSDDAPARQMLSILTDAMLPAPSGTNDLCILTVPGGSENVAQFERNAEFLCRLVRMKGFRPVVVNAAEASLLACGNESAFTGISVVMGAETISVCVSRYGVCIAKESIAIGSNWIDSEVARQFAIQQWDDEGNAYLDLETVRQWKQQGRVHLRNALSDRERALSRLYTVVLDRLARVIDTMLNSHAVKTVLQKQRMPVLLSGGAVMIDGFASLLTERFIEQELADRILSVRIAQDATTAVVRGGLIYGELEVRAQRKEDAA